MPILTLIDILGIQRFVFASNRLKDVVGGSQLVNECSGWDGWLAPQAQAGRVVVAAGGNALLIFETLDEARELAADFSRRVLDDAPGLDTVVVHREYAAGELSAAILASKIDVAAAKARRRPSVPLLGLSVTARCNETGAVATQLDPREGASVPISAGVAARREALLRCRKSDRKVLRNVEVAGLDESGLRLGFPFENDHLGRTHEETSWIGVVHVDGNGIGQRVAAWLAGCQARGAGDDEVVAQYRALSAGLNKLGQAAFEAVCRRVAGAIECNAKGKYVLACSALGQHLELKAKGGLLFMPVRPILIGGDDLTFLCDGRLALDLAEAAMAVYEAASVEVLGPVRACAGVALVKSHAPFSRAYVLAERLCGSAKGWLREAKAEMQCALDWHVGMVDPHEMLDSLRARDYRWRRGDLTCRPYLLGDPERPERESWRWLARTLLGDSTSEHGLRGRRWADHRGKARRLAIVAREGPDALADELAAWQTSQPTLVLPKGLERGFLEKKTPLLDAVELMDLHWPLGRSGEDAEERSAQP